MGSSVMAAIVCMKCIEICKNGRDSVGDIKVCKKFKLDHS